MIGPFNYEGFEEVSLLNAHIEASLETSLN